MAEAVEKELAKRSLPSFVGVRVEKPASISGSQSHGSVKRPHDMSEGSDSEADSDCDLGFGDVFGAGINAEKILPEQILPGLGDDLTGTIV